jgi:IS30 family transposase
MDYKSDPERLSTNPSKGRRVASKLDKDKKLKVKELLKEGVAIRAIEKETGVARTTVRGVRNEMEDNKEFNLGTWKKQTAMTLSQIVSKGGERLLSEIDNINPSQLPLAIAIMADKVMALQDAPTVVVEHRLRVSHNDINALIKGEVIDLPNDPPKDLPKLDA